MPDGVMLGKKKSILSFASLLFCFLPGSVWQPPGPVLLGQAGGLAQLAGRAFGPGAAQPTGPDRGPVQATGLASGLVFWGVFFSSQLLVALLPGHGTEPPTVTAAVK